jgi:hypothetical protein
MRPDHVVVLDKVYVDDSKGRVNLGLHIHNQKKLATAKNGDSIAAMEVVGEDPTGRVFLGLISALNIVDDGNNTIYMSITLNDSVVILDAKIEHSYQVEFDDKYMHMLKESPDGQDT